MSERMSLLEFLKERSGIRLSKLEAYLDLVDKASVQYIPKDLCKQEFSLSNGQFVITITELAGCWHWHRATVRTFIEQLEKMNQISVTRLTKSQIITIPMLAETPAVSPIDAALDVFRQKMCTALDEWRSGKMSASACASECEQLYEDATEEVAIILQKADNGNSIGKVPCGRNIPESVGHAFCMTALTAVCEATFHQVLSQETDNALVTSLSSLLLQRPGRRLALIHRGGKGNIRIGIGWQLTSLASGKRSHQVTVSVTLPTVPCHCSQPRGLLSIKRLY